MFLYYAGSYFSCFTTGDICCRNAQLSGSWVQLLEQHGHFIIWPSPVKSKYLLPVAQSIMGIYHLLVYRLDWVEDIGMYKFFFFTWESNDFRSTANYIEPPNVRRKIMCEFSGFRPRVIEAFALLGSYAAYIFFTVDSFVQRLFVTNLRRHYLSFHQLNLPAHNNVPSSYLHLHCFGNVTGPSAFEYSVML